MKFGVLGTGTVGRTLAGKLEELGHDVRVGSREAGDDKVTFADAASFAEVVVNATAGTASLDALEAAGADNLAGKLLIDVANPLDFSQGMPPTLSVCNDTSLAEQIQEAFPEAKVVKSLNTVNADVMVDPGLVPGSHTIFVAGNDDGAKAQVAELLQSFGWPAENVMDLGDIGAARGLEMYLPLWLRLMGATGTPHLNVKVLAAE
ncbi:MAG TPA: NAD(P)-binding domain-containing protein [Thermoleophilaceae bacterium]